MSFTRDLANIKRDQVAHAYVKFDGRTGQILGKRNVSSVVDGNATGSGPVSGPGRYRVYFQELVDSSYVVATSSSWGTGGKATTISCGTNNFNDYFFVGSILSYVSPGSPNIDWQDSKEVHCAVVGVTS